MDITDKQTRLSVFVLRHLTTGILHDAVHRDFIVKHPPQCHCSKNKKSHYAKKSSLIVD